MYIDFDELDRLEAAVDTLKQEVSNTDVQAGMHLYVISDLHVDYKQNLHWLQQLRPVADAALIVAGDVTDNMTLLRECLLLCKERFVEVFFVPGNHELCSKSVKETRNTVATSETVRGDIFQGVADHFLKLNEVALAYVEERLFKGEEKAVVSFSHFVPRQELLSDWLDPKARVFKRNWLLSGNEDIAVNFSKVAGTAGLEKQVLMASTSANGIKRIILLNIEDIFSALFLCWISEFLTIMLVTWKMSMTKK
ncbi:hypothetical protein CYMTET_46223 [Cymbomonas tetramitiformis]|uniref:Calcineurin-like phosphoesterase domain-containing protein n=1 Tax=Cymbomonas tetramitiformis TaxID=36881 RepID=A0AAE0BXV9_9CHLO|nr:hypothetical protein CYMTET_46223 [Cymbomonas tetramitiformis]